MIPPDTGRRSVVVEREFPHPPEKLWRALTEGDLIEQWLMKNDFQPVEGRAFRLRTEPLPKWDGVVDCRVLAVKAGRTLSYTWDALGLESVVTFTLTPTDAGTHLRMEQTGFRADQEAGYQGAGHGWRRFIAGLDRVVAGLP